MIALHFLILCFAAGIQYADHTITKNSDVIKNPFQELQNNGPPLIAHGKSALIQWGVYNAKVDNFDPNNKATYQMRYNYNLQFCAQESCPIVIYVGGEWTIDEGWLEAGQIYEIAKENGGAMFYTEHRFYGKSWPTNNFTTESLRLLHSSQAQEDIKGFIINLKSNPRYMNSKVFLFGCSYSGALVVWLKQKYPELIQVTYSTSAPFYAKNSMFEYLGVTTRVIRNISEIGNQCANHLYYGIQQLEQLYDNSSYGPEWVRKQLGICNPQTPRGTLDKAAIFQTFSIEFGNMNQENPDKLPGACMKLINSGNKNSASYEKLISYRTGGTPPQSCYYADYYASLSMFQDTSLSGTRRLWFYQQCNEFGWFETTESNQQVFGNSVHTDFYHQMCRDGYSQGFTENYLLETQQKTNANNGGKYPKVKKSVFVYGSIDPWAPLGVDQSLNDEALRFYIDGGDHCWDMFPESNSDSTSLRNAKRNTRAWIKKWLSE